MNVKRYHPSIFSTTARRAQQMALATLTLLAPTASVSAQSIEGTSYYLPQAVMRVVVKMEKTQYTPGRFAAYAGRYMKQHPSLESATTYRLIGLDIAQLARPDTARHFTLLIDKKHSISKVAQADNGQLLAINADAQASDPAMPVFTPAPRPEAVNPNDFMSADILNAGSTAKMAELTAREIYDIRDSRNQLSRGQADYMPKDGAQLRIMLANLDRQEQALSQLFEGSTTRDTTWTVVHFVPRKEGKTLLFRFSKLLGLVDNDDLAGAPYYVSVTDLHTVAPPAEAPAEKKEDKNDIGLRVSQPGKIRISIASDTETLNTCEISAPQFGHVESLSGELFGKKQSTRIVLDPLTGSVRSIESFATQ